MGRKFECDVWVLMMVNIMITLFWGVTPRIIRSIRGNYCLHIRCRICSYCIPKYGNLQGIINIQEYIFLLNFMFILTVCWNRFPFIRGVQLFSVHILWRCVLSCRFHFNVFYFIFSVSWSYIFSVWLHVLDFLFCGYNMLHMN